MQQLYSTDQLLTNNRLKMSTSLLKNNEFITNILPIIKRPQVKTTDNDLSRIITKQNVSNDTIISGKSFKIYCSIILTILENKSLNKIK